MPNKTPNLKLNIEYETNTKVITWRAGVDYNFTTIDTVYGQILSDISTALTSTDDWAQRITDNIAENNEIYAELAKKITKNPGESLVANELIEKLDEDYSKDEVDATFVTKETLANTTIKREDINLNNYYTKAEVNGIATAGSAEALKDYYTKEEIDEMLVGDADIQSIIDYLDALNGYELSMNEFDDLNGNGNNNGE